MSNTPKSQTIDEIVRQAFTAEYAEEAKQQVKSLIADTLRSIELPEKKDATDGENYMYSPETKIAVLNYNQAIEACQQAINAKIEELESQ